MQSFKMAWKSISGNKLRAALTMLGIIIGVMALVILVSLVNGATSSVTDTVSGMGKDSLAVSVLDPKDQPVSLEDLHTWMQEESIGLAAPLVQEQGTGEYGAETDTVQILGTTPSYYGIQGLSLRLGRFLKATDVEHHNAVCVVNEELADELIGYVDCLGEEISLNGMKYQIVGVLEEESAAVSGMAGNGGNHTLTAYLPYTSFVRLSTEATLDIDSFYLEAAEGHTMEEAERRMTAILMERFSQDEDAFSIRSQDILEDAMGDITSILTILLGGIAAISLVVGGIGIMNIMLVTVTERTKEIGIRKAIGATRGAILRQFLIEAIVLCMMGCAIGIFGSWCVLQAVTTVVSSLGMKFAMNGTVVLAAVVFCFAIGLVFGLYPANKAAKMKPIDAPRYSG